MKKLHERWFVICSEMKAIHDGFTMKQAMGKHKLAEGTKDHTVYRVRSTLPFSPKGRQPRDNEASFRIIGGKVVTTNCELEIVHESKEANATRATAAAQAKNLQRCPS